MTPIRKQIDVPLPPDAAFDLFTRDIARWWPGKSLSLSAANEDRPSDIQVEPHVGGRIMETMADGRKLPWATVTDWSPGQRFAVDWYVGRDPSEATELVVVFAPIEGGTSVHLTHAGFEAVPDSASLAARYDQGWSMVLCECFAQACTAQAA